MKNRQNPPKTFNNTMRLCAKNGKIVLTFTVIISGGLFIGGLYDGSGAKPLFLIFFDEFENFDQPVEVVARVVIDINSALAVVTDCADLCAEIALHA